MGGFYRTYIWSLASLQFTIRFNSILFADIVLVAMRWKGWIWAWGAGVGGGRGGDPRLASTWARWADNHIHCYLHLHLYLYLYRFCIQGLPKLRPGVVKITFIFMFFLSFPIFSLFCPVYTCISPLKSGGGQVHRNAQSMWRKQVLQPNGLKQELLLKPLIFWAASAAHYRT